jgi:hypothetical protein
MTIPPSFKSDILLYQYGCEKARVYAKKYRTLSTIEPSDSITGRRISYDGMKEEMMKKGNAHYA